MCSIFRALSAGSRAYLIAPFVLGCHAPDGLPHESDTPIFPAEQAWRPGGLGGNRRASEAEYGASPVRRESRMHLRDAASP
jgi:hypothetical protein